MGKAPTDCNDSCQCNGRLWGSDGDCSSCYQTLCRERLCPWKNTGTAGPQQLRNGPLQAGLPVHARISLRPMPVKGWFPAALWHVVALALDQGITPQEKGSAYARLSKRIIEACRGPCINTSVPEDSK